MTTGRILVVDDRENWRSQFRLMLEDAGYEVETAESRTEALRALRRVAFHLAVVDVRLIDSDPANTDGLAIIDAMEENHWPTAVIVITGYGKAAHEATPLLKRPRVKAILRKGELNADQFRALIAESLAESVAVSHEQQ